MYELTTREEIDNKANIRSAVCFGWYSMILLWTIDSGKKEKTVRIMYGTLRLIYIHIFFTYELQERNIINSMKFLFFRAPNSLQTPSYDFAPLLACGKIKVERVVSNGCESLINCVM